MRQWRDGSILDTILGSCLDLAFFTSPFPHIFEYVTLGACGRADACHPALSTGVRFACGLGVLGILGVPARRGRETRSTVRSRRACDAVGEVDAVARAGSAWRVAGRTIFQQLATGKTSV